jgi:hypoxanthine phosphoribosyltransferase
VNKLIIKQKEFNGLVAKICRDIVSSDWRPDYVVGITRGGLWPAVMISQYFDIPMQTLKVSLRDDVNADCESNLWMAEEAFGYIPNDFQEGIEKRSDPTFKKNILIVDDINDTGATLNWIMNDWKTGCLPFDEAWDNVWNNNVKFATIVDNLASKCEVGMDFVGMEVNKAENDVWIEFPYEEWWTK